MIKAFFLTAPDKIIDSRIKELQHKGYECLTATSMFELNKIAGKSRPDIIFVADNLKEKTISQLLPAVKENDILKRIPVIGIARNNANSMNDFFEYGAADVIDDMTPADEIIMRVNVRRREAGFQLALTDNTHFFSEAQEKEQGKRSGIFRFFDAQRRPVGEIAVKGGRIVSATYGKMIKADAFLQLVCNPVLQYRFSDYDEVPAGKMDESITNLLLEASKLKAEIKKQKRFDKNEINGLIIDDSRISRILAARALKELKVESKVVSAAEFSLRLIARFTPDFLIIDYTNAREILDQIWQSGHNIDDLPAIIYCDQDIKDINCTKIGDHLIEHILYKKELPDKINGILGTMFSVLPKQEKEGK